VIEPIAYGKRAKDIIFVVGKQALLVGFTDGLVVVSGCVPVPSDRLEPAWIRVPVMESSELLDRFQLQVWAWSDMSLRNYVQIHPVLGAMEVDHFTEPGESWFARVDGVAHLWVLGGLVAPGI
jgi:hypothetical protein